MSETKPAAKREMWSGRSVFIVSAIGSAIGLGNIWRFPYVAYEGGGGAFIIPYLCALLSAGLPLLLLDYTLGHKYRASPPLAYRRMKRSTEALGWWQVMIPVVIAIYYAAIIAWAGWYAIFSVNKAWGDDPTGFFAQQFLQSSDPAGGLSFTFVPMLLGGIVLVWIIILVIMLAGATKGIGRANMIMMPVLVVMFTILVIQALFMPGAATGLNALFTPNWAALADAGVWASAYGQIFFSLSVGFGIMITYSSYLKRKTDLPGSAAVVAFSNSSFEILAGIGVFAALGFMAVQQSVPVDQVVGSGIGLAFITFPTIISQAPLGALLGVLFFGSLVFGGLTSLISIVEVPIAALQDKTGMARKRAVLTIVLPLLVLSALLFGSTSSLSLLDVTDNFINTFGIMLSALVVCVVVSTLGFLPLFRKHLNETTSIRLGTWWQVLVGGISVVVLGYILITTGVKTGVEGYGDGEYPAWFVNVFGWGMVALVIVVAIILSRIPWSDKAEHASHGADIESADQLAAELNHEVDQEKTRRDMATAQHRVEDEERK